MVEAGNNNRNLAFGSRSRHHLEAWLGTDVFSFDLIQRLSRAPMIRSHKTKNEKIFRMMRRS